MREHQRKKLVYEIYDRVPEPTILESLGDLLTDSLDSHRTGIYAVNRSGSIVEAYVGGMEQKAYEDYFNYYSDLNPIMPRAMVALRSKTVMQSASLIGDREYKATEFYNDFAKPQRIFYDSGFFFTDGASTRAERDAQSHLWPRSTERRCAPGARGHSASA